ncbi:hypothetical protein ICN48_02160 [Polynucleobacter sp. JS-Safj-400b-B2]|uniref:hypothetical protein n=1 Tax=Polynucleobacter sp. JS-Safj-400b-B2 TaxID=2576921 RepID=UPI001C0BEBFC|nr:hypothetical protein [Polynucleobacter sp. JS-Safj-400b-B2]MBU3625045.1 hypothetical protein [Polynucleobacter sp. JS-Safj-400b-B2]
MLIKENIINYLLRAFKYFSFENLLFICYLSIYIRQYFWSFNGLVVWITSLIIATSIILYLRPPNGDIQNENKKFNTPFLLIVVLPLCLFYLLRFPFPDSSWDVINYHFINGERAVVGFPFIQGDFFYLSYSNPISDMLTTVFRHTLGHRLGTVLNLLVLIWSGLILEKILKFFTHRNYLRCIFIITLLSFEGIIYEISNYWVDLLAIPLILEITYLLSFVKHKTKRQYFFISLLMGMAVGLKLTNLYIILPALAIALYQYTKNNNLKSPSTYYSFLVCVVFFALPIIPFHSYVFWITGNPIYPHYNWIFRSPYASLKVMSDDTLGPESRFDAYFWPIVMLYKVGRLSPTPTYPFFASLGYLTSIGLFLFIALRKIRVPNNIQILCLLFAPSVFIWGVVSGDFRYVTVFEILGGVILISVGQLFLRENHWLSNKRFVSISVLKILKIIIVVFCVLKCTFSINNILKYEWAGRPTVFSNFSGYIKELRYVLKDYSLYEFLPEQSKSIVNLAQVWIPSSPVVSGYMVLLNPFIPYVDLHHLSMRGAAGTNKFNETIHDLGAKRYFSLINPGTLGLSLDWSLNELAKSGFVPLRLQNFVVPYFSSSPEYKYDFKIVELVPREFEADIERQSDSKKIAEMKSTLVLDQWLSGCYPEEMSGANSWRWCGKSSSLAFKNYANIPILVNFNFYVQTGSEKFSNLTIKGKAISDSIKVNNRASQFNGSVKVQAGETYVISLFTDADAIVAPSDPRSLHIKINNFTYSKSLPK